MKYKISDNILCNRQDSLGLAWGKIVKVCDNHPDYDYIIQVVSFSGKPIEAEYMYVSKDNIIGMYDVVYRQ